MDIINNDFMKGVIPECLPFYMATFNLFTL